MRRWKLSLLAMLMAVVLLACGAQKDEPAGEPGITLTPTVEATKAPEQTPTPEATNTPEGTLSPEATNTPEGTPTPEVTDEPEVTLTPEVTPTERPVKATATPKPTNTPKATATPKPTNTPKPTATPTPTQIVVSKGLKDVYAEYGLKAGTCLTDSMLNNAKCLEIIKANFNSITFENHMKPDYILNQQASISTGDIVVQYGSTAKKLLKWCKDNDMAVRGHVLVWYSQTPQWIFYDNFKTSGNLVSREVMLARMESYIKQSFEQLDDLGYLDLFYAFDIVNEAWMEDGTLRDNLWLQTIGEDYQWYAFYYADKYAPSDIDLYYNDYNEQYKTEALYKFVKTLVDENGKYLIDGIGLQAHLYTEDDLDDYLKTVKKLGTTGLKVNLTELDVCLGSWMNIKSATDANLKVQGQYYYNLISGILKLVKDGTVKMDSLTFWGFADNLSWRSERSPLLFNSSYKAKYAYYGALLMKEYAGFN